MTGAVASAPAPGDGFPDGTAVVAVDAIFEHGYDDGGEPLAEADDTGVVIGQHRDYPGELVTVRFENGRVSDVRTDLYDPPTEAEVRRADAFVKLPAVLLEIDGDVDDFAGHSGAVAGGINACYDDDPEGDL